MKKPRPRNVLIVLLTSITCFLGVAAESTPPEQIKVKAGFEVERLFSVPGERMGSWVVMCEDDQGRIIVGDQYGALYRFVTPPPGERLAEADIERIQVDIGHAQGLCYAFDSLYVVVNADQHGGRGLYRLRDSSNDGQFDQLTLLKKFTETGGEHGPHAVVPGPDGKSLYVVCGNQTPLPAEDYQACRPTAVWGEDQLLPRIYGRGFMKGAMAPRGWICKTDPEGKHWELIATGFRNPYDIDFNAQGELFTFDADMEWDLNTPWYRPTRINHVISGAEFGWRNGSAKWPEYYPDSFGSVVDVGPGSPTGVCFGTGAKFPARYQRALFAADWSFGKLYAVHLSPEGSSYRGEVEEFLGAQPLPLTDLCIGKQDGAMYFCVGGRKVQSGLYRVRYTGEESIAPAVADSGNVEQRKIRHQLEALHLAPAPDKLEEILPYLGSTDRALRYAARTALEKIPSAQWNEAALGATDPTTRIHGLVALARVGDKSLRKRSFDSLLELDYASLEVPRRLDYLRALALVSIRLGAAEGKRRDALISSLLAHYPAPGAAENLEISALLAFYQAEPLVAKSMDLLTGERSEQEQIGIANNLRLMTTGWNADLRKRYFEWFQRAATYRGGASFQPFIDAIKKDAVERLPDPEKQALAEVLKTRPAELPEGTRRQNVRFVKNWQMKDLEPLLAVGLEGGRDFQRGRRMFAATTCYNCHRFNGEGGGIGPDLSSAAGQFGPRDLLEAIIDPSKEISDQYGSVTFTLNNGKTLVGRIANLSGDTYQIITNLMSPGDLTSIKADQIKSQKPTPYSMMPAGLVNTLEDEEILDLLAFILSSGNPKDPLFEK